VPDRTTCSYRVATPGRSSLSQRRIPLAVQVCASHRWVVPTPVAFVPRTTGSTCMVGANPTSQVPGERQEILVA